MGKSSAKQGDFDAIQRRSRTKPSSTGKRVSPQERDLIWFTKLAEHGPLSTSYLHAFSKHLRTSEKRAKERLTDLFNEDNTPDGGTYLTRPQQQFRTLDSRYNELVYDLTPASRLALGEPALARDRYTQPSGPWLHGYMVSCITASIELATLERDDLNYIPQSKILKRASAELRYPTEIIDPIGKQRVCKNLIPDAFFGLEYLAHGQTFYRFFVVEADRGTEPATSRNFNRKSYTRNVLQYQDYIGNGRYKEHLKLTAPLIMLTVSSDAAKLKKMKCLIAKMTEELGCSYMCFREIEGFGVNFKPQKPQLHLLTRPWDRVGQAAFNIARR